MMFDTSLNEKKMSYLKHKGLVLIESLQLGFKLLHNLIDCCSKLIRP